MAEKIGEKGQRRKGKTMTEADFVNLFAWTPGRFIPFQAGGC
jgi:hypothetical protein